jgi:hypothetical protein
VQQQQRGRVGITGVPVEELDTVDLDSLVSRLSQWGRGRPPADAA